MKTRRKCRSWIPRRKTGHTVEVGKCGDFRHKSTEVRFHKLNRNKLLHKHSETILPCLNINMFN